MLTPAFRDQRASSGQRDKRVTIESRPSEDAVGGSGFPVESWSVVAIEWMSKQDFAADEQFKSAQLAASFTSVFRLAYRADMDPDVVDVTKLRRLVYQGRVFDILGARQVGRQAEIELITLAGSQQES